MKELKEGRGKEKRRMKLLFYNSKLCFALQ